MRVQVGKEKAPEWKLIYGVRDDTAAAPVIKQRHRQVLQGDPQVIFQLEQAIEIADQRRKIAAQQSHRETARQAINQRERAREGQREERGDRQVKRCRRGNAGQFYERADEYITVVVIIDVAAGIPGIKRRHIRTAQNGVQKSHLHGFFTAQVDIPQIGIERANPHEEQKCQRKQPLLDQQQPPAPPQKFHHLAPLQVKKRRAASQ